MRRIGLLLAFLLLPALLLACGGDANGTPTGAAPAPAISTLPPAVDAATSPAANTAVAAPTDAPIGVASPTPCGNDAAFLDDLTVPDFSQVTPGQRLDKQWLIRNTGSCAWDASYSVAYIGGVQMGAPEALAVYPAQPGTDAIIRIGFTAPDLPGDYESRWELRDRTGSPFGPVLFTKITVIGEEPAP